MVTLGGQSKNKLELVTLSFQFQNNHFAHKIKGKKFQDPNKVLVNKLRPKRLS